MTPFTLLCLAALAALLFQFSPLLFGGGFIAHGPGRWQLGVAVTPDLGHNTAIGFQTGFLAKVLSMEWSGIERVSVETTVLDTTGGKTFMPGDTYDPGTLTVELQFDTDSAWITALTAAAETVTVTWPDAETSSFSGFMTSFAINNVEKETVMTATVEIKATGSITV